MKFYVSFIDRISHGRAISGKYFNHAADAIRYAVPTCGYDASIIAYKNGSIKKMVRISKG